MSPDLGHAAHASVHLVAALALGGGGAIILALAARQRALVRPSIVAAGRGSAGALVAADSPEVAVGQSLRQIMAGLSVGAATIHLAAAPSHYAELGDFGAGFLAAAIFQFWWAQAWLTGPNARVAWSGAIVNAAIIGAWALSRTVGLPLASLSAAPEPIGLPDGATTAFEVLILVGLAITLLRLDARLARRMSVAPTMLAIGVVPAIGLILVTTSLATVAIVAGLDHGLPAAAEGIPTQRH